MDRWARRIHRPVDRDGLKKSSFLRMCDSGFIAEQRLRCPRGCSEKAIYRRSREGGSPGILQVLDSRLRGNDEVFSVSLRGIIQKPRSARAPALAGLIRNDFSRYFSLRNESRCQRIPLTHCARRRECRCQLNDPHVMNVYNQLKFMHGHQVGVRRL